MTDDPESGLAVDLARYRQLAEQWSALGSHPKRANEVFRELRLLGRKLAAAEEGREGVVALAEHTNGRVRLLAASQSLNWDDVRGVAVLEELEQQDALYAVSAKYTLKQYRAGTLQRD